MPAPKKMNPNSPLSLVIYNRNMSTMHIDLAKFESTMLSLAAEKDGDGKPVLKSKTDLITAAVRALREMAQVHPTHTAARRPLPQPPVSTEKAKRPANWTSLWTSKECGAKTFNQDAYDELKEIIVGRGDSFNHFKLLAELRTQFEEDGRWDEWVDWVRENFPDKAPSKDPSPRKTKETPTPPSKSHTKPKTPPTKAQTKAQTKASSDEEDAETETHRQTDKGKTKGKDHPMVKGKDQDHSEGDQDQSHSEEEDE